MKNIFFWGGEGGSVGGGAYKLSSPEKGGGLFERGGFIEDLRYLFFML